MIQGLIRFGGTALGAKGLPNHPIASASISPALLAKSSGQDTVSLRFGWQTHSSPANLLNPALSVKQFNDTLINRISHEYQANRPGLIADLTEIVDQVLQGKWMTQGVEGKKFLLTLKALKGLMGKRGQGNMVMAQINTTPGDIRGNAIKAMNYIKVAEAIGVDTVVFPEMTLMGYPIYDVITRHPHVVQENVKWLKAIASQTNKTKVVMGFVEPRTPQPGEKRYGKPYYNSLAILGKGKVQGLVRKTLLPTYGEFNEYRYFESSAAPGVLSPDQLGKASASQQMSDGLVDIGNYKAAVSVCEDIWNDDQFNDHPLYWQDPIAKLLQGQKADVLFNISASPSRENKEQLKHNMLSHTAKRYQTPLVYVNQVGAVDESSFDGASRVYDAQGKLVARSKAFSEQFMIVNPLKSEGKVYTNPSPTASQMKENREFDPWATYDLERTYHTVVQGIRDYFNKRGFTQKAVLGLSGGLDSAVVAKLLVDALGPENVIGVRMSSKITSGDSEVDAKQLADNLGMTVIDMPIRKHVAAFKESLDKVRPELREVWGKASKKTTTLENFQARARAVHLWGLANEYGALPIATSDKSELYMGYATIGGDMSGELAPIADIPKCKVRQLARWMNENCGVKNAIPERTISKPSGAELAVDPVTGKAINAEDELMPYEFLDEVIWRIEALGQTKDQMMNETFWYDKHGPWPNGIPAEEKQKWLDRFYQRMSYSVIKWKLAPPMIITSGNGSIALSDYNRPVVSKNIDWNTRNTQWMGQQLTQHSLAV